VLAGPITGKGDWAPKDLSLLAELPEDIVVHRVPGPLPGRVSRPRRILSNWLRLQSAFSNWWVNGAIEVGQRASQGVDLIVATMSPFESGEVAQALARQAGIPWVADLRDPWALDEMQQYPTAVHLNLELRKMERLLSTAALVVMNTPEAAAVVRERFASLDPAKVISITNGFDAEDFSGEPTPRTDGKFRIVHTGYLHTASGARLRKQKFRRLLGGITEGLDVLTRSHAILLKAVARWVERSPEVRNDLELVFAGELSAEDRELALQSEAAGLIRLPGYLPHTESLELIRTADLLFLPMHDLPKGRRSRIVPGKTYEYMATGRPILAAVPEGDARDFLDQCGTALVSSPRDCEEMSNILSKVYCSWKSKQTQCVSDASFLDKFERRALTKELANALRSIQ